MADTPRGSAELAQLARGRRPPQPEPRKTMRAMPVPAPTPEVAPETGPRSEPPARREAATEERAAVTKAPRPAGVPARPGVAAETTLPPDAPMRGLGQRVRAPVYERLDDVMHSLSKVGLRSSRTELLEMLLWQLPGQDDPTALAELADRLRDFRDRHPAQGRRR